MSDYRVQFEVFEGPLDLLLHLVKKQEVDIYQINITRITGEFVAYIERMRELDLEVAGEFVVMAATLIYIKSRELLPVDQQAKPADEEDDGDDPRWELIRRLVEYKKFKDAAALLQSEEARMDNVYEHRPGKVEFAPEPAAAKGAVSVFDLISAVSVILKRHHERTDVGEIQADQYTVSEKIDFLRQWTTDRPRFRLSELFLPARSRTEVVVTFLALLELIRLKFLICTQAEEFGEIDIEQAPVVPQEAARSGEPGGTEPPVELPPGSTPPADIVQPIIPPEPGTLPNPTPAADNADGPLPA